MHSPTLFSLLRKWPLPSPDRTEPVLNTGVMFDRQFSRLFFLQPPFLPSFSRVPGSTAPVRWRDEVGRAGTRVGRRVDKKTAVLFHLCLFFSPPHFPSSLSQLFLWLSWFLVLQGQGLYSAAIGVGLRFLSDSLV